MSESGDQIPYPAREPYYSHRFVRLLTTLSLAKEIGPLGTWMLTVIVHQEDAVRYSRAVSFWDSQLFDILGVRSLKTLREARAAVVEAGWLHYEPGTRGRAGRYWVTIPRPIEAAFGTAGDVTLGHVAVNGVEVEPAKSPATKVESVNSDSIESQSHPNREPDRDLFEVNFTSNRERTGNESGTNTGTNEGANGGTNTGRSGVPFYPIPVPIPDPKDKRAPPAASGLGMTSSIKKSARKKRQPLTAQDIDLPPPLDSPEFRQVLTTWFLHRAEIRRPVTEISANQLVKQMASIGSVRAIAAIEHSIAQGWTGVFENTKGTQHGDNSTSRGTSTSGRYISPHAEEDIARLVRVRASSAD